jgi:hypothetical protein
MSTVTRAASRSSTVPVCVASWLNSPVLACAMVMASPYSCHTCGRTCACSASSWPVSGASDWPVASAAVWMAFSRL